MIIRRRRGIEKMIIIVGRVSAACGELIPNPKCPAHRVRQRLYGNITASIGGNKYKVTFDDGTANEIKPNSVRIEDHTAGRPTLEASSSNADDTTETKGSYFLLQIQPRPKISTTKRTKFILEGTLQIMLVRTKTMSSPTTTE